jgi:hypothetical protein
MEEEEEGRRKEGGRRSLFIANAVSEEDPERDRATTGNMGVSPPPPCNSFKFFECCTCF